MATPAFCAGNAPSAAFSVGIDAAAAAAAAAAGGRGTPAWFMKEMIRRISSRAFACIKMKFFASRSVAILLSFRTEGEWA